MWHYSGRMKSIGSILLIKSGEGRQVSFFVALLVMLGAGMAIGRGSADVLFLKRYGIEYLPVMYLMLSLALAICFTIYAAFVDRVSSERFFYFLLSIEVLLLMGFWYTISYTSVQLAYPAYYIFYELVSELVLVHATFYIAQSLDTLQSKRLTSLILAGYQLGMIVGGLFFAVMMPSIGVEHSMLIWSGLIVFSISMLFIWHRRYGMSPFFIPPAKTKANRIYAAVQEVNRGLKYVRQSKLLKNACYALFFMVLMFYALTYSVNKIYTESFSSEAELAMFFGMLVAGTNFLAVAMQVFVSGRVVEKIGVRQSKLIYPLMTVVSYVLLLISPGFYTALIASINNSSVMPAFRNPTRQMFFNILPAYIRGRARATSVALVLPLALFVCGIMILYLQASENPDSIMYFGFFCAVMYWFFCYRMGKDYSTTLIENLKKKLYLPEDISKAAYVGDNENVYPVLLKGLSSDDNRVCMSYAQLLRNAYPQESIAPIMQRIKSAPAGVADRLIRMIGCEASDSVLSDLMKLADEGDDHLKATVYDVVLENAAGNYSTLIETALSAQHNRIKVSGIKAAIRSGFSELYQRGMTAWQEMLAGDWMQKMAVIDMQPLMTCVNDSQRNELKKSYIQRFVELLQEVDDDKKGVIYKAMSRWEDLESESLSAVIKRDMQCIDPKLRCAVAACLHVLSEDQGRNEHIWMMLSDGHVSVRQAALQVMQKLYQAPMDVYFEWLMNECDGTPRAQKVLLEALISHGVERVRLKQITDRKSEYTVELLRALSMMEEDSNAAMKMTRMVLEERLTEMIDLVLLSIEPTMEGASIAVIRAGLRSKDPSSVASAHEALQSIEDQQLAVLLSDIIDRRYDKAAKHGCGKHFLNSDDALQWCIKFGDTWLRECSDSALMVNEKQSYA